VILTRCILFCLLGALCGLVQGTDPQKQLVAIFLILTIAAYSCVIGTTTLTSLGADANERDFFAHEASLGVFQAGEALARMIVDVAPLTLLPLLFAAPLLGLTAHPAPLQDICGIFWLVMWGYTGIGYLVSMVFPGSAAVVYVAFAFVISTFIAGAFGLTVHDVVDSPGLRPPWVPFQLTFNYTLNQTTQLYTNELTNTVTDGYHDADGHGHFRLLPGFWSLFSLMMMWVNSLPHAEIRDWVLYEMRVSFGFLPGNFAQINQYERREVHWLSATFFHLYMFGFALRLFTIFIFWARNYTTSQLIQMTKLAIIDLIRGTMRLTIWTVELVRERWEEFGEWRAEQAARAARDGGGQSMATKSVDGESSRNGGPSSGRPKSANDLGHGSVSA